MSRRHLTGCLIGILSVCALTGSLFAAPEPQPVDRNKGITVDDLARGLRGAAQNIEKEIPKIGPAIGKAVKSFSGNSPQQTGSQHPSPGKNKK